MSEVKYSIQVCEDNVRLSGILNIEQMFDMLNYFEKKGFTHCLGADVNSIVLIKNDDDDFAIENFIDKDEHVQNVFEAMYEEEKSENIKLKSIIDTYASENEQLKNDNDALNSTISFLYLKIKGQIDGI